jgi:hypothetical protein
MTSPLERAKLLDAEMQLQRAWLELSLREVRAAAADSPWAKLRSMKLGSMGLSLLKHRSLWLAGASLLINVYRRHANKEKS